MNLLKSSFLSDTSTCFNTTVFLDAPKSNSALSFPRWQIVSGQGAIDGPFSFNQFYIPDATEKGQVVEVSFLGRSNTLPTQCNTSSDTIKILIEDVEESVVISENSYCSNSRANLLITNNAVGKSYTWDIINGLGRVETNFGLPQEASYLPSGSDEGQNIELELTTLNLNKPINCQQTVQSINFDIEERFEIQKVFSDSICESDTSDLKIEINKSYQNLQWEIVQGDGILQTTSSDTFYRYISTPNDTSSSVIVRFEVLESAPCQQQIREDFEVFVVPSPTVEVVSFPSKCPNDSSWINIKVAKAMSFTWNLMKGNGLFSFQPNVDSALYVSHQLDGGNSVQIEVVAQAKNRQCAETSNTIVFGVNAIDNFTVNQIEICQNDSFTLKVNEFQKVFWFSDILLQDTLANAIKYSGIGLAKDTTLYYFKSSGKCPPFNASEVKVIQHSLPQISIALSPSEINLEQDEITFLYQVENAIQGEWDFGDQNKSPFEILETSISHEYDLRNEVTLPSYFEGNVSLTSVFGCSSISPFNIPINIQSFFYIPNSFTPNGDGFNDVFKGEGINFTDLTLSIYNRWGNLIFYGQNEEALWDGTSNKNGTSKRASSGAYVYRYTFRNLNRKIETYQGFVHLVP